jgi:hypothetical protein
MTPMNRLIHLFSGLALSAGSLIAADAPRVVATPSADAGRGLVRVSDKEIRQTRVSKTFPPKANS